jgi:RimJ/RimL family protein N-acetyltransferase
VLNEWAVPQMGCTEVRAQCFMSNLGSVKLWEKHGFVEEPELRGEFSVSFDVYSLPAALPTFIFISTKLQLFLF